MSEIDIKVYIPPYNKQNFYSLMGNILLKEYIEENYLI